MVDYLGRNYGYNQPYANLYQPQPQPQQQPTMQMRTNKIFVTSLEDALNRYADPNTIIVYRHQDEKFEYEITTDSYGKKTYKTLEIAPYSASQDEKTEKTYIISKEDFDAVKQRLDSLEKEVAKKYKGGGKEE